MLVLWLLLLVTLLYWRLSRCAQSKLEPPEYPGALPLFGHLHLFLNANKDLWALYQKLSTHCLKTDNAILLNSLVTRQYVIADPDDALTVANACIEKNFMYHFAKPWVGNGLITAAEPKWKQHRKLLNPTFSLQVMYSYLDIFNRQARRLIQQMARHVGEGDFDHDPEIKQNSLETICMTAMGLDFIDNSVVDNEYTSAVKEMFLIILKRYLTPWLYIDLFFNQTRLKQRQDQCVELLQNVSDGVIKRWRKENENKLRDDKLNENFAGKKTKPFLELLLELYDYHGQFTDYEVKKHVDTIIASGYETVASVLFFSLTLIGSYPCVQERLADEMKTVFDNTDRDVQIQDLPNLIYLDAVIKESLRLYPAVPVVARYIDKEVKLKKSTLLAGRSCYLSIYGVHRHSIWGKDADEFRPERWLHPSTLPDNSKAFAAFSLGRRSCIGKVYAMMSLKTTLAHFLRRYKVTADYTKMKLSMDFLLRSVSGHEIAIELRMKTVFDNTDRDVQIQDLPNLIYLDAVIKESLRLYPAVPVVARYIDKEVKLKKSTLLAGRSCYLSIYGVHRHSIWGKDADEFRPERWLHPSTLPDNSKAFAAFSLGRRSCIGKVYAMMSLKTTLAHFLRRYKVTADYTKMKLSMDFLLRSVSGHEIAIELRSE